MKFLVAGAIALMMAVTTYFVNKSGQSANSASMDTVYHVSEAKRQFVEPETKNRPERFESMKWNPSAEMRSPASH